jgi:hypothetical protein
MLIFALERFCVLRYIFTILYKGFGFPYEGKNLRFVTTILDLDLSWSLGSTLYEANAMPWDLDGPHGETYKYEMGEAKNAGGRKPGNEKAVRGRKDPHLDQDDDTPVEDGRRSRKSWKADQTERKKEAKEEEKSSKKHHGSRRRRDHGRSRSEHESSGRKDDRHRDGDSSSGDRSDRKSKDSRDEDEGDDSGKEAKPDAGEAASTPTGAWQTPSVWGAVGVSFRTQPRPERCCEDSPLMPSYWASLSLSSSSFPAGSSLPWRGSSPSDRSEDLTKRSNLKPIPISAQSLVQVPLVQPTLSLMFYAHALKLVQYIVTRYT